MHRIFLIGLILFSSFVSAKNYDVKLGEDVVRVQHIPGEGKAFVHVHHNEQTALKAAKAVIQREGGSLITLVHPGGRNIVFHLQGQRYEFDPNRIFTDVGIKKTLKMYSQYSFEAQQEVKKLANQIKVLLPKNEKIIAVHNNASYSLKDYLPGHSLEADAKAIHILDSNYFRNFYLVTRLGDFMRLKCKGFNGVLQKESAVDDGSLSVYLAKNEYINVEAGHDQLAEQIKMLRHA